LHLRGLINTNTSAPVVSEAHTGYLGGFIRFNNIPDLSVAVTVTDVGAVTTYTEGTDYELGNTGIKLLAGGTMVDAAGVEISYTSATSYNIQGVADSVKEYELIV